MFTKLIKWNWAIVSVFILWSCKSEKAETDDLKETPSKPPKVISNPKIYHVDKWCKLPDIEDLPEDKWTPLRGTGPLQNSSAYARGWKQARIYLSDFDEYVSKLTNNQLLQALAKTGRNYNRAEYATALIGNKIILNELHSRHSKAPLKFNNPEQYYKTIPEGYSRHFMPLLIYTGSSGPPSFIDSLIEHLETPK